MTSSAQNWLDDLTETLTERNQELAVVRAQFAALEQILTRIVAHVLKRCPEEIKPDRDLVDVMSSLVDERMSLQDRVQKLETAVKLSRKAISLYDADIHLKELIKHLDTVLGDSVEPS